MNNTSPHGESQVIEPCLFSVGGVGGYGGIVGKTDLLNGTAQIRITMNDRGRLSRPSGDENIYATNDLYLTTYLVAGGIALDSHARVNGKTTFRHVEKDGLDQIIREYDSDSGLVPGLRLFDTLRKLKNLLYLNMDCCGKDITRWPPPKKGGDQRFG